MTITKLENDRWQVESTATPRATLLARHLNVEDAPTIPWYDGEVRIQAQQCIVSAPTTPCIAVSQQTPNDVVNFLGEQGYPVTRCDQEEIQKFATYIDKPEGFGTTAEAQAASKSALIEQIEALEMPLLHFGCWPNGNRAALAVSGDIDSITVQDFFLRIIEVFQQR